VGIYCQDSGNERCLVRIISSSWSAQELTLRLIPAVLESNPFAHQGNATTLARAEARLADLTSSPFRLTEAHDDHRLRSVSLQSASSRLALDDHFVANMDKHALVKHPFTSKGRAALKEGRDTDIEQVDEKDRRELKERDAWDKLGYSSVGVAPSFHTSHHCHRLFMRS
jgi:hypothetical protein